MMADSGLRGVEALRAWTNGLSLKRNLLYAMDEISNVELPVSALDNLPVYVKYSTLKGGDAYMKEYRGEFSGVIFQPFLADEEFRQYGNFPLSVF